MEKITIEKHYLTDDGIFPNNAALPVLIYHDTLTLKGNEEENAEIIERLFRKNDWKNTWRNGIYDFHHYHSNTHEVLAVCNGDATVQFGGPKGPVILISMGDVILIPAGVAHKCIHAPSGFKCIGAYPGGVSFDVCRGADDERPQSELNIRQAGLPHSDPVFGKEGPVNKWWTAKVA